MPKTKSAAKRKKKRSNVILMPPIGKGNIDPKLIREAVIAVRDQRLREEAAARDKAAVTIGTDAGKSE
jgi:hypothetical protein